jgi:hypothetical protein
VAASLTILFTVGYLVLREGDISSIEKPLLSENKTEEITETPAQTEIILPEVIAETKTNNEKQQLAEELKTKPTSPQPSAKPADSFPITQQVQPKTPENLVAMTEQKEEEAPVKVEIGETPKISVEIPATTQPTLPPLELEKAVAEVAPSEVEEPTYRVKIYSDGLKEESKDKNLIAGIGKTVTEVEGLLGKVDQGFADLQDAKNNLFASITTRKTKAEK